jgi:hypothetical protein
MPLLFFTREMLHWRGVDVLNLNPATNSPDFKNLSESGQSAWLKTGVDAGIEAGLRQGRYSGLILGGKSIGSLSVAASDLTLADGRSTALLWITPLFRRDSVFQAALAFNGPQVFLCGAEDSTYSPDRLDQILKNQPQATAIVVERANHSLEVPGDDHATFKGLSQAMLFLGSFLNQLLGII